MFKGLKSLKLAILYGFFIWLFPFLVSIMIYPIKAAMPELFESLISIIITLSVVIFSVLYFSKTTNNHLREAIIFGVIWLALCLALDMPMFMWGPMKMTFGKYFADIGLTYLMIPIITIGYGYLLEKKNNQN